jgi:hypothetical protein
VNYSRFRELALEAFDFVTVIGFRCVRAVETFVRFESDRVFLNVYYGRRSREVGVELGRLEDEDENRPFSAETILRSVDPEAADSYRPPAAVSDRLLQSELHRLAEIIRQHGAGLLRGDLGEFERLEGTRQDAMKRLAAEVLASQTRPRAEKAFRERDFALAARLYESIEESLAPVERKKLLYAKRHLAT